MSQERDIAHFPLKTTKLSFLAGLVRNMVANMVRLQLNVSMDIFGQRKEICISGGFIFVANFIQKTLSDTEQQDLLSTVLPLVIIILALSLFLNWNCSLFCQK